LHNGPSQGTFEFACASCGVSETVTLTFASQAPTCRCGRPLLPIAHVANPNIADVCEEAFLAEVWETATPLREEQHCLKLTDKHPDPSASLAPSDASEYLPLDHPHVEPYCQFCAARQAPRQHRLWCGVFFFRDCDCGYERR
jgi:hypothetical protein